MVSPLPRLRYFAFPGRCYAARVALFNTLGKGGWVDERLGLTQFKKMKAQFAIERKGGETSPGSGLVANNLPQLVLPDGVTTVTQSHAIARWAARQGYSTPFSMSSGDQRKYILYPDNDPDSALLVDEVMSLVDSIVGFAPKDEEKNIRLAKRVEYASEDGFMGIGMRLLESRLETSSARGPFLLGSELTIGDLYLKKPLTDMILDRHFDGVEPDYLAKFPRIRQHTVKVAEHPLVIEYLKHYPN